MTYVGEKESTEYPGFYHVPGISDLVANPDGIFIHTGKRKVLEHYAGSDYPSVYPHKKRVLVHRALALTFLPPPLGPVEEFDVNHKDGIKTNFSLGNLEWSTRSMNCIHAYETGLRFDNTPILVKDLRTESISRYNSLQACARAFGVNGSSIHFHLQEKNFGKIVKQFFVFIREGQQWPNLSKENIGTYRQGSPRPVYVTKEDETEKYIFESLAFAANTLGFKADAVRYSVLKYPGKPYQGWIFRFNDDSEVPLKNWTRSVKIKHRAGIRRPVPIRVTNKITEEVTVWPSSESFAKTHGLKKNSFQKNIWHNNGRWGDYQVEYLKNHS